MEQEANMYLFKIKDKQLKLTATLTGKIPKHSIYTQSTCTLNEMVKQKVLVYVDARHLPKRS